VGIPDGLLGYYHTVESDRYCVEVSDDYVKTGGMAAVFKGKDKMMDRAIALKMILPGTKIYSDIEDDSEFKTFVREAKLLAQITDPNVVKVYDFCVAQTDVGPLPMIVMEWVEGKTLKQLGRLEEPFLSMIINKAGSVFDYLHELGVTHGDIKPSSIMLPEGEEYDVRVHEMKVVDVGLSPLAIGPAHKTYLAGSPGYVSPIVISGNAITFEDFKDNDIRCFASTVFTLITGYNMFVDDNSTDKADTGTVKKNPSYSMDLHINKLWKREFRHMADDPEMVKRYGGNAEKLDEVISQVYFDGGCSSCREFIDKVLPLLKKNN